MERPVSASNLFHPSIEMTPQLIGKIPRIPSAGEREVDGGLHGDPAGLAINVLPGCRAPFTHSVSDSDSIDLVVITGKQGHDRQLRAPSNWAGARSNSQTVTAEVDAMETDNLTLAASVPITRAKVKSRRVSPFCVLVEQRLYAFSAR